MNEEKKVLDKNKVDNFEIELITLDSEFLGDCITTMNSKKY